MKVALIVSALTARGGGQRQMLQLANKLQQKGWKVRLFTSEYDSQGCYPDLCRSLNIQSFSGPRKKRHGFPLTQIVDTINILRIGYHIYQYRPDILNPHDWPANWMACVAKLLAHKKKKIIWMCNEVWHVYNPYQKGKPSMALKSRLVLDKALTGEFVDQVVVLDNRIKRLIKKLYGMDAIVIRSGLDTERYRSFKLSDKKRRQLRQSLGIAQKELFLLSVAIFFRHRRFEDSILAIEKIVRQKAESVQSRLRYIIVGSNRADYAYFQTIQALIKTHKLEEKVKIISSPVSDEELLSYYGACDIFIFPNDKQTWGLAPIEAMALGKPCIVSKGAGVHEVLTDGKNALLVEPRNPSELADKLIRLINDPKLRKKLGQNGQKLVLSRFSWESYAIEMEQVFKKTISQK